MKQKILRKLRGRYNLSQLIMSNILGVPLRTYCKYEDGVRNIPFVLISKIEKIFGISIPIRHCSDFSNRYIKHTGSRLKKLRQDSYFLAKEIAYKMAFIMDITGIWRIGIPFHRENFSSSFVRH